MPNLAQTMITNGGRVTDPEPHEIVRLLDDIESAMVMLSATPAVREVGSQVLSGGRPGSRPPGDLRVIDILDADETKRNRDAVLPTLVSWARMICEDLNELGLEDAGPNGVALVEITRYLRSRAGYATTQAWIGDYRDELTTIRRALVRMPGSPLWREIVERIPCISVVGDNNVPCRGQIETRVTEVGGKIQVASRCNACQRIYNDDAMAFAQADQTAAVNLRTAAECIADLAQHGVTIDARQIEYWAGRNDITRGPKRGHERTYNLEQVARRARRDLRRAEHTRPVAGEPQPCTLGLAGTTVSSAPSVRSCL